jgi:D-glycero-D-manno-heptose 1,7-bisphosphate phosphatase
LRALGNLPKSFLTPAVFLDRDGTINAPIIRAGKPYPPATLEEFQLLEGVASGCQMLKQAGFILVVTTNQPDVGRGTQSQAVVEAIHQQLRRLVPTIDHIEVNYDAGNTPASTPRRKPAPGMLIDSAKTLGLDLMQSWMVGDRWRDIDCGQAAGCRTVFIDLGHDEKLRSEPNFTVPNFMAAVRIILGHKSDGPIGNFQKQSR